MMVRIYPIIAFMAVCVAFSCEQSVSQKKATASKKYEIEKQAILETINNETEAAFSRDYEAWKTHWVHRPGISKTYINFADSTFSEMIGWKAIDDFVRTYIEEHPEAVLPPVLPDKAEVKIYGNGAWVSYEVMDEVFGLKRESRLMEKIGNEWKIAGLHTTIYGFEERE